MRIHKEGHNIIISTFILLTLLNLLLYRVASKSLLFYFVLLVSVGVFILIINFFRSPNRIFRNKEPGMIVAPADGTIVVIEEVMENEYFHEKRLQVSVFMSLFNAHINWIPCDGKVIHSSHQNGRFMAAYLPKSSIENERSTIVIERENGEQILVRQIAGAMAKRIVTYAKPGKNYEINQQLGFIKFGSRVDLFLPLHADIKVDLDVGVKGNLTLIAQL
ncbi:MAG: phosphatidylserine decarboxylase family protein [Dysgonamonadaceae bacterium]|jgi:phosphatidylserine decarboxylase|nr:phosphatidylserine decarboxylase family protein [Dysgonamonadaceae bacterium]